jgi:hypothetical protein
MFLDDILDFQCPMNWELTHSSNIIYKAFVLPINPILSMRSFMDGRGGEGREGEREGVMLGENNRVHDNTSALFSENSRGRMSWVT